ncbi:hypothetical protein LCGC14_0351680 [marine sediment metagenome]|uniref:Uncharacterized protein n=1 Tax=marine sediment metagenome TaxID=412755 RepID=A0A0F9TGE3_9ZZZZ
MRWRDKIIKVLRLNESIYEVNALTYLDIWNQKYETIATEIEKLFEMEGKVEYVVQYKLGNWGDLHDYQKTKKGARTYIKKERKHFLPRNPDLFRLIKRVTTEQIMEE